MITGITMTCFAASYFVALAVEISRFAVQAKVRSVLVQVIMLAGFLAHTLYLTAHARAELAGGQLIPLSNWHDFCLLAAWVLVGAYLGLSLRRPQLAVGVFLLPLVLLLIGIAWLRRDAPAFSTGEAAGYWRTIHAGALLLGTVGVTLGFATGIMHLIHSYRLKSKLPPNPRFRLPSLEWLQRFNREALFISAGLLAVGLLAGVILNFGNRAGNAGSVPWNHPVVVSSGILFLWLSAALAFEAVYKPAREGHKVAYLTVASFVFLGMVLYFVLFSQHGGASLPALRNLESGDEIASHRM